MEGLIKIVAEWGKDGKKAKRLLIAGDFLNGTQLSSHPKLVVEDFKVEVTEGIKLLKWFSEEFEEVILQDDNHICSRWNRHIAKALTPDLHFLLVHPYDYIVANLPNVKRSSTTFKTKFAEDIGWLCQIGDAIFSHAELSSAVEFRTARRVEDFVKKWNPVLDFGEVRFIAQAHNHKLGIYHDYNSALAYTGCLLSMEAITYSMLAGSMGSPPIAGYLVLEQENGRTNLNETKVVRL